MTNRRDEFDIHEVPPDGGDIGVRYTPEMLEMLKKARELRKKGIIKF